MKMLIAGGGTGGHVNPGIALAQELTTRQKDNDVLFVGSPRGIENELVPKAGYALKTIEIAGIKGRGIGGMLRGLFMVPRALWHSLRILGEYRPDVALGVGGYASGPVILAAWLRGIPTAIQEQNAYPGLANRILGRFVRAVFISFDAAGGHFPRRKVQRIGNPIRRGFMDNFIQPERQSSEHFTIFYLGGSQGAHAVNLLGMEAAQYLKEAIPNLRIVHQTGAKDLELVQQRYEALGVEAEVSAYFDDMTARYRDASLVVCRAGATTVAELTVCRRASLLIPYPYAANDHQVMNASELTESGAAIMMRQSETDGEKLAKQIIELHADPKRLEDMARKAGSLGRPEAAREIIDVCFELMKGGRK